MNRNEHVRALRVPVVGSTVSTVHRASALDHRACTTFWRNTMWGVMPCSSAVSWMYARIAGPSAIALAFVHGLNA